MSDLITDRTGSAIARRKSIASPVYRPMVRISTGEKSAKVRRGEQREYRFVWAVAFLFFLVVALVVRFLPRAWRPDPIGSGQYRTVFGEAKAIANMTIPHAF